MTQPAFLPTPETNVAMDPENPQHEDQASSPNESPLPSQASTAAQDAPAGVSGLPTSSTPFMKPAAAAAGAIPQTKPNLAGKLPGNPLPAILGAALVLLLGFALTQTNDRITRLEDKVDTGFAKIGERFTAQDAKLDARFAEQDAKFDEINLKLTALIAALNATEQVEAALDGRLLDPQRPTPHRTHKPMTTGNAPESQIGSELN